MTHEPVSGQLQLCRVGTLAPLSNGDGSLDNSLAVEEAVRPRIVQAIDSRVDLAAHGICGHPEQTPRPCAPCRPRRGIQG